MLARLEEPVFEPPGPSELVSSFSEDSCSRLSMIKGLHQEVSWMWMVFLLAAFKGGHISRLTRAITMSSQFLGCGCFPRMLDSLSEFSLLPHRLIVTSASCCCTFSPFISLSCREATGSTVL